MSGCWIPVLDSPIRPTFATTVEDIVVLDDYTVRFDLVGPNAFFLDALSLQQVRILPADVDTSSGCTLEEFGTGPFILEELLPGERVTMVRNPDYWEEGKPYVDKYVILGIREAATRAEALKSGDVDVIFDLEFQSVPSIEAHPETVVLETPGSGWIGMPMRQRPYRPSTTSWSDRRCKRRRTGKASCKRRCWGGAKSPMTTPFHPTTPSSRLNMHPRWSTTPSWPSSC